MAVLVISYSRVDQPQVRAVVSLLTATLRDVQKAVFWDGELEPGDPWFDQIKQHIDAAPQLFVFWCDHSARSQQVRREFTYAITQKKRVVPVLLDDTELAPELAPVHGIDLRGVIHHDSSRTVRRPTALSPLNILVAVGAAMALFFVASLLPARESPSAGLGPFTVTAITLAFLALYAFLKSRRRPAVKEPGAQISSDAIERIVAEFSRHIDESSIR